MPQWLFSSRRANALPGLSLPSPLRLLLVSALLLLLIGTGPAQAQLTRIPLVAVLDFGVPAGNNRILARQVTDAVVLEMQRTGTYDVVPRSQVREAIDALGFSGPLERTSLLRLGQALGVQYLVTGQLENLSILKDREGVRTTVSALFLDIATGEYVNGTVASGVALAPYTSSESPDALGERLLFQALGNAAFQAVENLNAFELPQATVLNVGKDSVLLNGGIRTGIRVGQEFIILRRGQKVGRVRVTSSDAQNATAAIIDIGRGIRPEDKARAIVSPGELPQAVR